MAASTRSLGMLTLLAFSWQRRRAGLVAGSGPPALTAMAISLPIRENCLAIRSHRANIVDFLTSNMRPIDAKTFLVRVQNYGFNLAEKTRLSAYCYFCYNQNR